MEADIFWKKVKQILSDRDKRQDWLCDKAGIPLSTLRNKISISRMPTFEEVMKILKVFNMSLDEFMAYPDIPDKDVINIPVYEQALSAGKGQELVGLLGFDWDAGSGLNIMAQYVGDAIFDGAKELDRKAYTHLATLTLEKSLMNELLSLTLHGELDLCEFSSLINAETEYSLTDSVKLGLIGNFFFEGKDNENGEYGIYRDLSCITLKGKISF